MAARTLVHEDGRGFFLESFAAREMEAHGLTSNFVQDNHARSCTAGVVRGLHFQKPPFDQAKLVRVVRGEVFDAVVDLRKKSKTFGTWLGFTLSEENKRMLYFRGDLPTATARSRRTRSFCTRLTPSMIRSTTPAYAGTTRPRRCVAGAGPLVSDKDGKLPFLKDIKSPF